MNESRTAELRGRNTIQALLWICLLLILVCGVPTSTRARRHVSHVSPVANKRAHRPAGRVVAHSGIYDCPKSTLDNLNRKVCDPFEPTSVESGDTTG